MGRTSVLPIFLFRNLFIQRDIQFIGKLLCVERAAGEIAFAHLHCGDFPLAAIGAKDDLLAFFILLNIHFLKVTPRSSRKVLVRRQSGHHSEP